MRIHALKDINQAIDGSKIDLIESVENIPYKSRAVLLAHLRLLSEKAQIDAATKESETDIRRAQGAFAAIEKIIDTLETEQRSEGVPNPGGRAMRLNGLNV